MQTLPEQANRTARRSSIRITLSQLVRQGSQRHDGLGVVTGGGMAGTDAARRRGDRAAMRIGEGTSPGVGAARRSRRLRRDDLRAASSAVAARTGARHGFEQRARVGVRAAIEKILRSPLLDDAPQVNHRDLVAQILHHREVMADQDVAQSELVLQVFQQIEHLRLHRDVQRADRLVGDDQSGLRDQGPRDGDALALAAGEFVREFFHVGIAQADLLQHRGDPAALLGAVDTTERGQRFGDNARNRLARIERTLGILEHHLEIAPGVAQFSGGQPMQVAPEQSHRAGCRRLQRHHHARKG